MHTSLTSIRSVNLWLTHLSCRTRNCLTSSTQYQSRHKGSLQWKELKLTIVNTKNLEIPQIYCLQANLSKRTPFLKPIQKVYSKWTSTIT